MPARFSGMPTPNKKVVPIVRKAKQAEQPKLASVRLRLVRPLIIGAKQRPRG